MEESEEQSSSLWLAVLGFKKVYIATLLHNASTRVSNQHTLEKHKHFCLGCMLLIYL